MTKKRTYTAIGETKLRMQIAACSSTTLYQVYLDLKKTYDSINRGRVLLLLEKYRVGTNIQKYIETVWSGQQYVLRQGGFFSQPVEANRGCTQGDIDSPIIFNVIVDAVIRSWKANSDYRNSKSCFYADDGLLEGTDAGDVQKDLDMIIDLFGKVGLKANESKTKFMVIRGAAAPRAMTTEAYNNRQRDRKSRPRITVQESRYEKWRRMRVECNICGAKMQNASLQRHMMNQHSRQHQVYRCREAKERGDTYTIENIRKGRHNECPVEGCNGGGKEKFHIYRHFCIRHPEDKIIISEDGVLPKCGLCGMRMMDIPKHQKSQTCGKLRTRRMNEEKQDKQAEAEKVRFTVNGKPIQKVKRFLYLGRTLTSNDDDTICIDENLRKPRNRWNSIAKILKVEGASAKCMGKFYITVVQAVLLYGADTWVITQRNLKKLRSFHWRAVRYMTGRHIRKVSDNEWEYPEHEKLLKECGLVHIEEYIERRRGTLWKYLQENRGELLVETTTCAKHCRDVNKLVWWQQPYIKKGNTVRS